MREPATLYFAYGSNLNRNEMGRRCPRSRPAAPARLAGWRLTFRGVADVEPAPGRVVHGALWHLGAGDLERLDAYEGAPTSYRRHALEVETAAGPHPALVYVMPDRDYLGLPSPSYLRRIEQGYGDWELPLHELKRSLAELQDELADIGAIGFRSDGAKRLRAVLDREREGR